MDPRELARRVERAAARQNAAYGDAAGAKCVSVCGGWSIFAGAGSPMSQAVALALDGTVSEAELERMLAHVGGGNVEVTPWADPSLAAGLAARRLRVSEFHQVLVKSLLGDLPAVEIEVRPIRAGEERAWAKVVIAGFTENDEGSPEAEAMALPTTRTAGTTCYGAWIGDEMIGGGTLAVDREENVATLSGSAVRPGFRGRGAHAALIRARLVAARQAGMEWAASSTMPASQSQRNLEREGFRVLYPKVVLTASGGAAAS
jgi:hypothetical protein